MCHIKDRKLNTELHGLSFLERSIRGAVGHPSESNCRHIVVLSTESCLLWDETTE